ncbi:MAG: hypothetical protein JWO05_1947 [Gemmatimonadetes bacterium]|nr:hypothetical protein [Gemmatimonadota bacterium]
MRVRPSRSLALVALVAAVSLPATRLGAQAGLTHVDDAQPLAPGVLRFRLLNAWARFDQRVGANGTTQPLGAAFTSDSLGPRQLGFLSSLEGTLSTVTGSPFRLSLGGIHTDANARVVTTPLVFDYGVSRRLSVGFVLPVVETRVTVSAHPLGGGNVGLNPATTGSASASVNAALLTQFSTASTQLAQALASCANSTTPSCIALNARRSAAQAFLADAATYQSALGAIYSSTSPALLVPRAGSAAQTLINNRIGSYSTSFRDYLVSASEPITARPAAAARDVGLADLQAVLGASALDTLRSSDRIGIGDLEFSARYLLVDGFVARRDSNPSSSALQYRVMLTGVARLGTGVHPSDSSLFDLGVATGQGAVEGRVAADVRFAGRLAATVAAQYAHPVGSQSLSRIPSFGGLPFAVSRPGAIAATLGDVLALQVTPRWFFSDYLSINGAYGLQRIAGTRYEPVVTNNPLADPALCPQFTICGPLAAATAPSMVSQQAGIGLSYTTLGRRSLFTGLPMELTFLHLETLSASGAGTPRGTRDQVELRIFYRVRGR